MNLMLTLLLLLSTLNLITSAPFQSRLHKGQTDAMTDFFHGVGNLNPLRNYVKIGKRILNWVAGDHDDVQAGNVVADKAEAKQPSDKKDRLGDDGGKDMVIKQSTILDETKDVVDDRASLVKALDLAIRKAMCKDWSNGPGSSSPGISRVSGLPGCIHPFMVDHSSDESLDTSVGLVMIGAGTLPAGGAMCLAAGCVRGSRVGDRQPEMDDAQPEEMEMTEVRQSAWGEEGLVEAPQALQPVLQLSGVSDSTDEEGFGEVVESLEPLVAAGAL